MIFRLTPAFAALVGETAAEWQLLALVSVPVSILHDSS